MNRIISTYRGIAILILSLGLQFWSPGATGGFAQELAGFVGLESRLFPASPAHDSQGLSGFSLVIQPEYEYVWDNGHQVILKPFLRLDQYDAKRTHFDVREAYWLYYRDNWEIKAGVQKYFWGVTESQHLVDVINQTDLVGNFDGEQKLGQPTINFSIIDDWGSLDLFVLPGFRERTFAGRDGRFRFAQPVRASRAVYEADAEELHTDFAARFTRTFGMVDVGLSHFYGTSREPAFRFRPAGNAGAIDIVPKYFLMNQTGLDMQLTRGGWLLKWENIVRWTQGERFLALTGGFEYTFSNINNSGIDLGVLSEYLYDGRDQDVAPNALLPSLPPNIFDNHVFSGARLALNDVKDTSVLVGSMVNLDEGSMFWNLEADRRINDRWKATFEVRVFANTNQQEILHQFRRDSYLQLQINRYF